ncbi:MAG: recombinase family protein [Oscillospiraceae bacterium]
MSFSYKSFLGYRKGADGKPEIVPEQAVTVRQIYERFLSGRSLQQIADELTGSGIPTPMGKTVWQPGVIQSILSNEKYKGDALLGKTYTEDCISKKVRVNAGERPQYYVENNHPAIIDAATFARVQEELARRASKRKVKQVGTKTEQGKYSSKYALTELLVCGECGTPYRRCTWTVGGKKKIVWRCISRLDFGKKYCHHSPTMEEAPLQEAIMDAVLKNRAGQSGCSPNLEAAYPDGDWCGRRRRRERRDTNPHCRNRSGVQGNTQQRNCRESTTASHRFTDYRTDDRETEARKQAGGICRRGTAPQKYRLPIGSDFYHPRWDEEPSADLWRSGDPANPAVCSGGIQGENPGSLYRWT